MFTPWCTVLSQLASYQCITCIDNTCRVSKVSWNMYKVPTIAKIRMLRYVHLPNRFRVKKGHAHVQYFIYCIVSSLTSRVTRAHSKMNGRATTVHRVLTYSVSKYYNVYPLMYCAISDRFIPIHHLHWQHLYDQNPSLRTPPKSIQSQKGAYKRTIFIYYNAPSLISRVTHAHGKWTVLTKSLGSKTALQQCIGSLHLHSR